MNLAGSLSRFGFDPERLRYSLRTALAACLALFIAWAVGLEHPQWSAMTVFAASQPARNMLVEKSFFRAAGTLLGTGVGVLIVAASGAEPAFLVLGLSLWVGACALLGNVQRGLVAYGTLLAGYSAAMVALLDTGHPDQILLLGADRLLTVMTGVATALAIGLLFTPADAEDLVVGRARRLTATLLRHMTRRLRHEDEDTAAYQRDLLREMALIEEAIDRHGAGSLRSRRSARTLRIVLSAQVSALMWLKTSGEHPDAPGVAEALAEAGRLLDAAAPLAEVVAAIERAVELAAANPALQDVLREMAAALRDRLGVAPHDAPDRRAIRPVVLHRDWTAARHAALRATGILLLLGAVWVATGWESGPYLLLGTAVMATLFSTWDNPAWIMGHVLAGQVFGAVGALVCRWLVWPQAESEIGLVFMLMPFVLVGVLPLAHRRTMWGATDYCMVLLLLSQPTMPLMGGPGESLSRAAAVVAGPLIALIGFRLVFPADATRRMRMLIHTMVRELQDMAKRPDAPKHEEVWRARLQHRLLRLVGWSEKSAQRDFLPDEAALAVLAVGTAVLKMHEIRPRADLGPGAARAIDTALGRVRTLLRRPDRAAAALATAARRLEVAGRAEPELAPAAGRLSAAAASLRENRAFFAAATGEPGPRPPALRQ